MDSTKTGQFIRQKRIEKNMTQKQLSEKMHVTVSAISQYENGRRIPDISVMELLCEILGISLTELIRAEDIQEQNQNDNEIKEIVHFSKQIVTETKRKTTLLILTVLICSAIVIAAISRKKVYSLKEGYTAFHRNYHFTNPDSDYTILPQIQFLTMNNTFEILTRDNVTLEGTYTQRGNDIFCTTKSLKNTYHFQLASDEELVFLEEGSDYLFDIDSYDHCTFTLENYTPAEQYDIPAEENTTNTFQEIPYDPHIHPYMEGYLADFGFYRLLTDGKIQSYQIHCLSCEKNKWTDSIILEEPVRGHSIDLGIHLEDHLYHFYRFDTYGNTVKEICGNYPGNTKPSSDALHMHDLESFEKINASSFIIFEHLVGNTSIAENITDTDCDHALVFTILLIPVD